MNILSASGGGNSYYDQLTVGFFQWGWNEQVQGDGADALTPAVDVSGAGYLEAIDVAYQGSGVSYVSITLEIDGIVSVMDKYCFFSVSGKVNALDAPVRFATSCKVYITETKDPVGLSIKGRIL